MIASVVSTNLAYIALTFLPPILWLVFYLREDRHPEPKHLLLLAFMGGMAGTIPAVLAECGLIGFFGQSCTQDVSFTMNPLILLFGISLIEEYTKYLMIKLLIIKKPQFDEPIDAMIYLITAALGFAALENTLFIFPVFQQSFLSGLQITFNRFLGANLLHALSSGIVGYFFSRAFFLPHRHHFIAFGILIATLFHTVFNYLILVQGSLDEGTFYVVLLLTTMTVMVLMDFERLKQNRSLPPALPPN